jgi:hypothetical protein
LRIRNTSIVAILAVIVLVSTGFVVWAETPLGPMPEVDSVLNSDSNVDVSTGKWLTFSPHGSNSTTGFIIYPGGRVDFRSYAPEAREIAAKGFFVVIIKMPLNLAVFGINKAESVIKSYPDIKIWTVGGHSLGGTTAAQFARDNPSTVKGLVLWASYPSSEANMSKMNTQVVRFTVQMTGS